MQFVRAENLKAGMRLARPIYNRQGVLLFERNSQLTAQGIASIANFGLIGLFILEPAEPVPPMTREDIEFERFQTMAVFAIQEELEYILNKKKQQKLQSIASMIIKNYGHLDARINFIQNLRSREDYNYKHALNVAILCAMITHVLNVRLDEQLSTVMAALLHELPHQLIETVLYEGASVRRICAQSDRAILDMQEGKELSVKMVTGAKILAVAEMYDTMTAMNIDAPPESEVAALKFLLEKSDFFVPTVVKALIRSVNILVPGVSVELNTGEKALVIKEGELDILRPVVLSFQDNSIIDLNNKEIYGDIEISDIMKTLDNRYIFDTETLKKAGIHIEQQCFNNK